MLEPAKDDAALTRNAQKHLHNEEYTGKKRRNGEPDHATGVVATVRKWGGVVAILAGLPTVGGMVFAVTNIWFQSDAEAQEAWDKAREAARIEHITVRAEIAQERARNDNQERVLTQINAKLDRQEILALKAERRGLRSEIEAAGNDRAKRDRLERQLEAVEEDLRIKGIQ